MIWDDEAEHPQGVIDMSLDGWSYIRYGPHYDCIAALNVAAFNFAQAANNFAQVALAAQAANTATAPTHPLAKLSLLRDNNARECETLNIVRPCVECVFVIIGSR